MRPSLEQLVQGLGGVATRAALIQLRSRAEVDRALREERLVKAGRGKYALPSLGEARRTAAALHAVASHLSAAQAYGWEMKHPPDRPCVTFKRNRSLAPEQLRGIEPHWGVLREGEVRGGWVTSPERTFVDCCRTLPFDEALAVADSALRAGTLTTDRMRVLANALRGPGSRCARRVAAEASSMAANPFESVLRAIALDVPGLSVEPQVLVTTKPYPIRPDLVDRKQRLVIEADSYQWHGGRDALRRDCRRYSILAALGWRVLRFAWEDVMFEPDFVRSVLTLTVTPGLPWPLPVAA